MISMQRIVRASRFYTLLAASSPAHGYFWFLLVASVNCASRPRPTLSHQTNRLLGYSVFNWTCFPMELQRHWFETLPPLLGSQNYLLNEYLGQRGEIRSP